jgi:GDP-mannose 6-dehydrogenase
MKLSVFGLGYVGCVTAACLADAGHLTIGVDISPLKVDMVNSGRSPIVEPGMDELISSSVGSGRLLATGDPVHAVMESDLSLVCVGTPGGQNGSLDLSIVRTVCRQIGEAIEAKRSRHLVVIRSTILPESYAQVVRPALEVYSGKRTGDGFSLAANPEFLREGTSINDFNHPPFTLIGADEDEAAAVLKGLYSHLAAPIVRTTIEEAAMAKYASNCFHALKICFANEIGNICARLGVDGLRVMEVVCRDTKLNISSAYMTPGFAFGGSCLPKDLRALTYKARELDVDAPLLNSIMVSNRRQLDQAVEIVLKTGCKRIGILGMSFKAGTDDLRESPMVALIETLIGKGLKLSIYDRDVEMARLFGSNREFIEREIPHIASLVKSDIDEVVDAAEVIIIGKREANYRGLAERQCRGRILIDLVNLVGRKDTRTVVEVAATGARYANSLG